MVYAHPVCENRLYSPLRQFLAEYLCDKSLGNAEKDAGEKGNGACGGIYSFNEEEMAAALAARISEYTAKSAVRVNVRTGRGCILLPVSRINYIRRENGAAVFRMSDKRTFRGTVLRTSFKTALAKMPGLENFILAGVGMALNPARIRSFHVNTVFFDNGEEEYLSDRLYYKAKREYEERVRSQFFLDNSLDLSI